MSSKRQGTPTRWQLLFFSIPLALLAFALYVNTFGNQFTNWDDNRYITENPLIRDLGVASIARMFSRFYFSDYAPITLLTYGVDYSLWQFNPLGYHLTNNLLHAFNCILLFWLMQKISASNRVALITSLLFAVHPVQVESVAWMAERKNLVAMIFFLLSFITHVESRRNTPAVNPLDARNTSEELQRKAESGPRNVEDGRARARGYRSFLSSFFYLLAVLSKPVVVGAPLLFAAYDRWYRGLAWREILRRNAPTFLIGVLGTALGVASQYVAGGVKSFRGGNPFLTWLMMSRVLWDYIQSLVLPLSLDNLYLYPTERLSAYPEILLGIFLIPLAVWFAWRQPLGRPLCAFAVVWFAVFLLPVANIIPLAVLRADRYMYFPAIGAFLAVGLAVDKLWRLSNRMHAGLTAKIGVAAILAATVVSFAFLTISRNRVWQSSKTLWEDHLKKNPRSPTGHFNLAGYYLVRKEYDRAIPLYQALLRIDPNYMKAYYDLATIASEQGKLDEAIGYCRHAIRLAPREKVLRNNLGFAYHRKGLYKEAIDAYQQALELDPQYEKARINMGYAYLKSGYPERAWGCFEAAQALDPSNVESYRGQGLALWEARDLKGATAAFERAVRLRPQNPELLAYLAQSYNACGEAERALPYARKAVQLDPNRSFSFHMLADCYSALGRKDLAQEAYRRAAMLDSQSQRQ